MSEDEARVKMLERRVAELERAAAGGGGPVEPLPAAVPDCLAVRGAVDAMIADVVRARENGVGKPQRVQAMYDLLVADYPAAPAETARRLGFLCACLLDDLGAEQS